MICFNFQIFNFFHCSYPMGLLSFWKYIKIMNDKYLHINYLLLQLTVACNTRSLIRFVRTTVVGIPDTTFFNSIVVAHTRKYMDCISIPLPELSIWTSTWLTFPHVHLNTGERERGGERGKREFAEKSFHLEKRKRRSAAIICYLKKWEKRVSPQQIGKV